MHTRRFVGLSLLLVFVLLIAACVAPTPAPAPAPAEPAVAGGDAAKPLKIAYIPQNLSLIHI